MLNNMNIVVFTLGIVTILLSLALLKEKQTNINNGYKIRHLIRVVSDNTESELAEILSIELERCINSK